MIRLENLSKSFRREGMETPIVHDLSLVIPAGCNMALLGRNGAGKSSLLRLISGEIRPDEGRVVREARVSWPLGFAGSFHKALSGRQNIRFVARVYGADVEELTAFVQDFSELGPYLDQPVGTYSSGMKARLAFGVSMGIRFDTYLVDEITAVGDQNFKIKCRETFRHRLQGANVIMVSHSMNTLRTYCDCGLVLENGRVEVYENLEDAIARHLDNMRRSRGVEDEKGAGPARGRRRREARRSARRRAARTRAEEGV